MQVVCRIFAPPVFGKFILPIVESWLIGKPDTFVLLNTIFYDNPTTRKQPCIEYCLLSIIQSVIITTATASCQHEHYSTHPEQKTFFHCLHD